MKIMSYVFWQVSSSIKLQPEKIMTGKRYSRLAVGWNKSQITVCCLKRQTPTITGKNYDPKKKVQPSGRWLEYMSKYKHQLRQEKITTGKRYSCLAYTICNTRNILFLLCACTFFSFRVIIFLVL